MYKLHWVAFLLWGVQPALLFLKGRKVPGRSRKEDPVNESYFGSSIYCWRFAFFSWATTDLSINIYTRTRHNDVHLIALWFKFRLVEEKKAGTIEFVSIHAIRSNRIHNWITTTSPQRNFFKNKTMRKKRCVGKKKEKKPKPTRCVGIRGKTRETAINTAWTCVCITFLRFHSYYCRQLCFSLHIFLF